MMDMKKEPRLFLDRYAMLVQEHRMIVGYNRIVTNLTDAEITNHMKRLLETIPTEKSSAQTCDAETHPDPDLQAQ